MKIAFTITDVACAVHAGGEVERETHIVEVPDASIPDEVLRLLQRRTTNAVDFCTLSLSVIRESVATPKAETKTPLEVKPLSGKWKTKCDVCGAVYDNGVGSTPCCGALQSIIEQGAATTNEE